jgi:hypothetical protein
MKKTNIYGFGYLEPGDLTAELLDMDQRRFYAIENNVQHLYKVFGNGVLVETGGIVSASWEIRPSTNNDLTVYITPGEGHVAWKYCQTTQNTTVNLPLTSAIFPVKFWIYATENQTTPSLGTVTFIASLVEINDPVNYIGLGAVTISIGSNGNYVYSISNDAANGRVVINLFNTLASRVNAHKHVGGTRNPSPIDLSAHVQGKLSGDYISDLDASKITKGVLATERLPQIDHNSLARRGTLTHTEIDSLLADLNYPTGSRLSDLFIANMMQLAMALKKQPDLDEIDKNLANVIMYQPGYNADDNFAAYYSTWASTDLTGIEEPYVPADLALAEINKSQHRIRGGNPTTVSSDNVFWRTDVDFNRAFQETYNLANNKSQHIEIVNTGDPAYVKLLKPYRFVNLSNPELDSYPDIYSTARGWTFAFITTFDDPNSPNQFDVNTYLFKYFRDADNNNITYDFSILDKLAISYAISNASSNVYLYLVLSSGGTAVTFDKTNNATSINKSTEVTLYTLNTAGSEEDIKSFNIDAFISTLTNDQKQSIVGFGFRWINDTDLNIQLKDADLNTSSSKLTTNDYKRAQQARIYGISEEEILASPDSAIFVWNEKYYYDSGQLVIRFNDSSGNPSFSSIIEDVTNETNGAAVRFFTRVASTEINLNSAAFYEINSDNTISSENNKGSWIDIKVLITPSSDKQSSPYVDKVGLSYIRAGVGSDKFWNTRYEFTNQGLTFNNVSIQTNESPFGVGTTLSGTLTFTLGSKTVTGSGTNFTAQLESGDYLYSGTGTGLGVVDTITNSTTLVLLSNASAAYSGIVKKAGGNTDFLQIASTSDVGSFKFLKHDANGHSTFYTAVKAAIASNQTEDPIYTGMTADPANGGLYTTPYQVFEKTSLSGLEKARDVFILNNNHAVIADTLNDRVVEIDEAGFFVRAVQGNVRLKRNVRDFVALTAYYNSRTATLYICFSQYFLLSNQAKINIKSADQTISFDNTGRSSSNSVDVSYFSPVTWATGAGNGANIPTTAKYTGQKTATLKAVFKGTLKTQIDSWPTNDIYVNIEDGAVTWNGNDGIAYPSTATDDTNYGSDLPSYIKTPKSLYKNVGGTGEFKSQEFVAFKGLIPTEITTVNGDFNGDNILPEGTTTTSATLLGPDGTTPVKIKVFVGDIVMDNLFSPISIQAIESNQWVVASCGEYSINRYDAYGTNLSRFKIPYTTIKFIEGKGGSAYLMTNGTNLNNRNLLIAAPAQSGVDGKIMLINQISNASTATNLITFTITTTGLDAVRAIPDPDNLHYWAALDDNVTNGLSSKVVKYDSSGNIKLEWGSGERDLTHPVGLSFTENGDLLISE